MPKVLAIGEALIDALSIEFSNSLKEAKEFRIQAGGSPANFCSYLQQIGTDATLVAAVGKDGFGEVVLRALEEKGLNTQYVQCLEKRATSLIMVSRSTGTPDFLPYRDADRYLEPVAPQLVKSADLVHTTAFALSRQPARGVILDAMEQASENSKGVSVDWNYSSKIWRKHKKAKAVFERMCSMKPLLKFSMDDTERFLEKNVTLNEAKAFLENVPAKAICLTCGKNGVWYKTAEQDWAHQAASLVKIKDATGAGDSFWAGFVSAFLQGLDLHTCVSEGMAVAARKLQGLQLK